MRIILISDTHLAEVASAFTANVAAAIDWIDQEAPDLVIHLGDVTADGAGEPAQFAYARQVLSGLRAPLLALPGNHDVGENPPHGGAKEPSFDLGRLAAFRAALGEDRWRRAADGWTLIGLNSQLFASETEEERVQMDWLDAQLAEADDRIALFLHKPLVLDHLAETAEHSRFVPPRARRGLIQRLQGRGLKLVASGHVHQRRRRMIEGVEHLWAPSAAFIIPDSVQERIGEKAVGLTLLELDARGVHSAWVSPPGMRPLDVLDYPEVYPQVRGLRP